MVVRKDKNVESIGKVAELPNEITPLQIGTTGRANNVSFTIIGRARLAWQDGFWNEWFLYMDDGSRAWLAEAQGTLAICYEEEAKRSKKAENDNLKISEYVTINGNKLLVADIKIAEIVGTEGELPFVAEKGRRARYIDLIGRNGEFGGYEISSDGQRCYIGQYYEFADLNLQNLRELEGWKAS